MGMNPHHKTSGKIAVATDVLPRYQVGGQWLMKQGLDSRPKLARHKRKHG